jgi:hypothetical protein
VGVQVSLSAHNSPMSEGIIMYTTLKRILSKHTTEADIVAWKGFLLGVIIAVALIGPIISLVLIFIFNEHTDVDELIVEHINHYIRVIMGYTL